MGLCEGLSDDSIRMITMHEMGHALARETEHTEAGTTMAEGFDKDTPRHITPEYLEYIRK